MFAKNCAPPENALFSNENCGHLTRLESIFFYEKYICVSKFIIIFHKVFKDLSIRLVFKLYQSLCSFLPLITYQLFQDQQKHIPGPLPGEEGTGSFRTIRDERLSGIIGLGQGIRQNKSKQTNRGHGTIEHTEERHSERRGHIREPEV